MKIRMDFVSNSSSSSFVLWGTTLSKKDVHDAVKTSITKEQYEKIRSKWMPEYDKFIDAIEDGDQDYVINILESICSTIIYDYGSEEYYIGEHPRFMKDDETLAEFKKKISDNLATLSESFRDKTIKLFCGSNSDGYVSLDCI